MRCNFQRTVLFTLVLIFPAYTWAESSYDIVGFYAATETPSGTLGLSESDDIFELNMVLSPTKINPGKYQVTIKRIAPNLYEIVGKDIFIKTRYCYEYSYGDEVILNISSSTGYSLGKVIFD